MINAIKGTMELNMKAIRVSTYLSHCLTGNTTLRVLERSHQVNNQVIHGKRRRHC